MSILGDINKMGTNLSLLIVVTQGSGNRFTQKVSCNFSFAENVSMLVNRAIKIMHLLFTLTNKMTR